MTCAPHADCRCQAGKESQTACELAKATCMKAGITGVCIRRRPGCIAGLALGVRRPLPPQLPPQLPAARPGWHLPRVHLTQVGSCPVDNMFKLAGVPQAPCRTVHSFWLPCVLCHECHALRGMQLGLQQLRVGRQRRRSTRALRGGPLRALLPPPLPGARNRSCERCATSCGRQWRRGVPTRGCICWQDRSAAGRRQPSSVPRACMLWVRRRWQGHTPAAMHPLPPRLVCQVCL